MRHTARYIAALLALFTWLLPAHAAAQSAGQRAANTCFYPARAIFQSSLACTKDRQCGHGRMCRKGVCVINPTAPPLPEPEVDRVFEDDPARGAEQRVAQPDPRQDVTTVEECGADRRCRIDRLRRKNEARRYVQMIEEDERARRVQERYAQERREEQPRLVKPLAAEFYVSFLGPGLGASYTFNGRWRLDATLSFYDQYIYDEVTVEGQTLYVEGNLNTRTFAAAGTYLFRTGWWSPYMTLGAMYSRGGMTPYYYSEDFFDVSDGSDSTVIMHLLHGSVGFDTQLKLGLRGRLGLALRQAIYTQARYGPGNYDDSTRQMVEGWFRQNQRVGVEFSIGWAF